MTAARDIAVAFSEHRFTEACPHLADDVRWVLVGGPTLVGRDAVVRACEQTTAGLVGVVTDFPRFVVVTDADGSAAAVDAVGRYTAPDGTVTLVASCDVFELRHGQVVRITSYTVEVGADG